MQKIKQSSVKSDPSKEFLLDIYRKLDEIVEWINEYETNRDRNQD